MASPVFEDFQNGFRVTVFNESVLNKYNVTEDVTEDITNKVGDNVGVNVGVKMLLVFIENNPRTNAITMEKHFKVTQRTIERWMQLLREENKIEFKGESKTGHWKITDKQHNDI